MSRPRPRYNKDDQQKNASYAELLLDKMEKYTIFSGSTKGEKDALNFIDGIEGHKTFDKISEGISSIPTASGKETEKKAALAEGFKKMQECYDELREFSNPERDLSIYNEEKWDSLMEKIDGFNDLKDVLYSFNEMTGYSHITEPLMNAAFGAVRAANSVSAISYDIANSQYMIEVQKNQSNMDNKMHRIIPDLKKSLDECYADGINIVQLEKDCKVLENITRRAEEDVRKGKELMQEVDKQIDLVENRPVYENECNVKEKDYQIAVQQRKKASAGRSEFAQEGRKIQEKLNTLKELFLDNGFRDLESYYDQLDTLMLEEGDPEIDEEIADVKDAIKDLEENSPTIEGFSLKQYSSLRDSLQLANDNMDKGGRNYNKAKAIEEDAFLELQKYAKAKGLDFDSEQIKTRAEQNEKSIDELTKERTEAEHSAKSAEKVGGSEVDMLKKINGIYKEYVEEKEEIIERNNKAVDKNIDLVDRFRTAAETYSVLHDQRERTEENIDSLNEFNIDSRINSSLADFASKLGKNKRFLHSDSAEFKAMGNAIKGYQKQPSRENMEAIQKAAEQYIAAKMKGRENDTKTTSMRDYRLNLAAELRDFAKSHNRLAEKAASCRTDLERCTAKMDSYKELTNTLQDKINERSISTSEKSSLSKRVSNAKKAYENSEKTRRDDFVKLRNEMQSSPRSIGKQLLNKVEQNLNPEKKQETLQMGSLS